MRRVLLAAALAAAAPVAGRADPTDTCHCFRNRSFDPADPRSADPYVLATARSSLLSAAFGVPKRDLVRAAMGGTAPEDLSIAYWAGARSGRDAGALLEARAAKGSWKAALAGAKGLGEPFEAALASGGADAQLAALAVDDVLVSRADVSPEDVALLRAACAASEEVVVAAVLAKRLGAPAMPILARVRSHDATWGSVLHDAGIAPQELESVVRKLVR